MRRSALADRPIVVNALRMQVSGSGFGHASHIEAEFAEKAEGSRRRAPQTDARQPG
jgi:hypothetical protein